MAANPSLQDCDPELFQLIQKEKARQVNGLEMIASENFTSRAVMECMGSCLTNKYAEGYPGARYYGGNEVVDEIERLAQARTLAAFNVDPAEWSVNVQPYSGSPANFAVLAGLLEPHDRLMGLDLPSGGHLTHGYQTPTKKISLTSKFWESCPYGLTPEGLIDYDSLETFAATYRPKLIIAGISAYSRDLDYARFRKICDSVGALLMADIAHISGLVAAGELGNPFPFCDIVTSTTHKSLRGPRAGIIFIRRTKNGEPTGLEEKVNFTVFPGLQGGPHEHQIAGIATQMREVVTPEFKAYSKQVVANARALSAAMAERGMKIMTGGTDNHLVLWDMRPYELTGSKMEKVLELISISVNKNTVAGDKSALSPGGIRIGTPALTTRGFKEADMVKVADFFVRAKDLALKVQSESGKPIKAFQEALAKCPDLEPIKKEVEAFAATFPMPGN